MFELRCEAEAPLTDIANEIGGERGLACAREAVQNRKSVFHGCGDCL